MSYVNKPHKINFGLDDNDFEIVQKLKKEYNCTTADLFRNILWNANSDMLFLLKDLQKEIHEIRQDLLKLVRS